MNRTKFRPHHNSVLALCLVVCLFGIAGLFFDFYYDLNDDVLIKDIVSGAYTGSPDAHSIQMLYPVSFIISLLYKILPMMPWQGLFLCGCHGICFYLIAKRSLSFTEKTINKIFLLLTEGVLMIALFLWELVMVQYTVTSALLAACACFLVFTQDTEESFQKPDESIHETKKDILLSFLKKNAVSIVLVILAYNIRSEMLLLMSPFIALTGILKWSQEKTVFSIDNIKKYLGLIAVILLGMGLSLLIDFIAYSGTEWKTFRDFFDARTRVYDYTWYPSYEEAKEFYHEIGLTEAQVELIDNYNFGLDEAIDADTLWSITEYAEENSVRRPLAGRLKEAVIDYKWRTFHEQDAPYNYIVLAAYAMVIGLAIVCKDKSAIWKLPLMWIFRTIPWMYVILAKRVPPRISHPLYYIELIILCAWMFSYSEKKKETEDRYRGLKSSLILCVALLFVCGIIQLPQVWQNLENELSRRESVNAVMQKFDVYAKAHPDNYYYMDVYSTVDFSEKMFQNVDNCHKNYDILGGWASGSPLQKKATVAFHEDMLSRAELLLLDNFYFVAEDGADTSFLEAFYRGQGMEISVSEKEQIIAANKTLCIYKLDVVGNIIN